MFDQREEDGVVMLRHGEIPARAEDAVRTAVSLCPSGAIRMAD
jgi:ferredoxin